MQTCSVGCTLAKDQVIYLCACVKLGEFRGTSSDFSTHFQTNETVHYAFLCLLRLSHDLQTFLNVLRHTDLFSGMYTSQGSGDILVRMCEVGRISWYTSALSTYFQTSETVHYVFLCLLRLSHELHTSLIVLMHVDLFSGM